MRDLSGNWQLYYNGVQSDIGNIMIINLGFGCASRHHIYYATERKCGTLKLWSPFSRSVMGSNLIEAERDLSSNEMVRQKSLANILFQESQQIEFAIADESDLLNILTVLAAVKSGRESSFISKEGRKIAFALTKQGKTKNDVITVHIQYSQAAKLTMGEAHKLHTILMGILHDLGYSDEEISKRLKSLG
jgi:hypothetical protein